MTPEAAPLYTKSQDLCSWVVERTERFRKSQRFVLGQRLAATAVELHQELALALRFRRSRSIRERKARWGAEGLQTSRKPLSLFRLPGLFLLRLAERRFLASLFQEPPRSTRSASMCGPPLSSLRPGGRDFPGNHARC
jgi:hypothetical protein